MNKILYNLSTNESSCTAILSIIENHGVHSIHIEEVDLPLVELGIASMCTCSAAPDTTYTSIYRS